MARTKKRDITKPLKISTQMGYRHIKAFEEAMRQHEMMGAMHPDTHEDVQSQYDKAKERLTQFMIQSITTVGEPVHGKGCGCHYCD